MFGKQNLVFYYCISPLHMGAGTAVGAIDNPIQREVHSKHPVMNGAGIKGAIRHHVARTWKESAKGKISELFGSDTNASGEWHAGALSFTDGQLLLFPVRSLKNTFVYATCPYALARLKRLAEIAGLNTEWTIPNVDEDKALISTNACLVGDKLTLEAFQYTAREDQTAQIIAEWLKSHATSAENGDYFRNKIGNDLVVLSNSQFDYFVQNATVVEPHVRIDDATGTAADGALYYCENLPPESVMIGLVLASVERTKEKTAGERRSAENALKELFDGDAECIGINRSIVQMGGDATTGRGLILINAVGR